MDTADTVEEDTVVTVEEDTVVTVEEADGVGDDDLIT